MAPATIEVQLENELPGELSVGSGTALFVCGWCFCPRGRIRRLEFELNGGRQRVIAHGMPRLDPFRATHPDLDPFATAGIGSDPSSVLDPLMLSYRSGFWGILRIEAQSAGAELSVALHAELEDGGSAVAELARIRVVRAPDPIAARFAHGAGGPPVTICMATYNPPVDLLGRQLESIRAQTHENWLCVISDDCSRPQAYAEIEEAVADDPRFVLSRSPRRLGFYYNFERALSLAPQGTAFVAMADQDDVWAPRKLELLLGAIADAQLVYSDARVVSRDGELISDTWWNRRRNNHSDLLSLLVANAVTGAASLMRRELLDHALPFPPAQFAHFHDHWIALVALAMGRIEYVDQALYDYVQHRGASLGHAAANQMTSLRDRLSHQRDARERARMWRLHYFADVCRLRQFATVLEMRCRDHMSVGKRRILDRFLATDDSLPSVLRLGVRGARELVGRPETLGAEWMLFHAFLWRRLLVLSARERPQRRLRLDALPPTSLVALPGHPGLDESIRTVADKIAPLRWSARDDAPERVNLLLPTIDLQHFFGGYIAKLNLARRLVDEGMRVRIVTVDPVGPLPGAWKAKLESYSGLAGLFDKLEVVFGREASAIEVSRGDSFIATTWWTAHIARDALPSTGADRFVYLIQEYEPFTFPMGSWAALAAESYRFPHFALFSSELLRDYFRTQSIGVYADSVSDGDLHSAAFQNAITRVRPPSADELASRTVRKLLFYARPEPHAARNMFELGVLALARAAQEGVFAGGWALNGIGTVERGRRILLGGGTSLEVLPRSGQSAYAELLREHDVGLALMYTPHPSLVPIEMASAGMLTVTNSFENKDPESMRAISSNLITAEPTIEGIAGALGEAVAGVSDFDRRMRGSEVRWSRDWDQSFSPHLLTLLVSVLGPARVSSV